MTVIHETKDRKIIPRWRDFRTTLLTGELDPVGIAKPPHKHRPASLASRILAWRTNQSPSFAADLVASAFVLGEEDEPEVKEAARFLLSRNTASSEAAQLLSRRILDVETAALSSENLPKLTVDDLHSRLRLLRRRAREEPRNALLWADMALAYATLGQEESASRAMDLAAKLAPNNRFVLRSAARLHVHRGDVEHALFILRRAQRTRQDPWLLAADIAVSSVRSKTSPFIRAARTALLSAHFDAFHTAELASALGTLELGAGQLRRAKKLFRDSLTAPTENAVAQAVWASRQQVGIEISKRDLATFRSFEARAYEAFHQARWEDALSEATRWFRDQPFSRRPASLGAFVAAVPLRQFDRAIEICRAGLKANGADFGLLNDLVFGLANLGRMEEAKQEFERINSGELSDLERVVWMATSGLLQFRSGRPEIGEQLYIEAIEKAGATTIKQLRPMACVFFALEKRRAGLPVNEWILRTISKHLQTDPDHVFKLLAARLADATEGPG